MLQSNTWIEPFVCILYTAIKYINIMPILYDNFDNEHDARQRPLISMVACMNHLCGQCIAKNSISIL